MTNPQPNSQTLLQHFDSEALHLPNRMVMAPLTRGRAANAEHVPSDISVTYYTQRATAGLIVTEGTHISPRANGWIHVPGIYTAEQTEGWKRVTDSVHQAGGRIFCQLWHQGRLSHPSLLNGELPLAPSALTREGVNAFTERGYTPSPTPHAATIEEIHRTVAEFAHAAQCAGKAGFDGVEIHGANGYLIHQFLSGQSNVRTDEYGESAENRARFLFEVIAAVLSVLPAERIGLRLSPSMHGMQGIDIDRQTAPTFEYVVRELNKYNLAYLHLLEPMKPVDDVPHAIVNVASHFRPLYKGTLMINKGFTRETGNKILEEGGADLVSFGTLFLANPDLVRRFYEQAPLNEPDKDTFYTPGPKGYIDYPALPNLGASAS